MNSAVDLIPTATGEQWRVDYDVDSSDIVAFNLHHTRKSPTMRRFWVLQFCLIGFAAVLLAIELALGDRLRQPRPATRFVWPAVLAAIPLYLIVARRRIVARRVNTLLREGINRSWASRRTLIMTPDEIYESWTLGKSALKWAAFEKVEATADHLFLYQSAISATTIPRRAFESQAAFDSFVAAARRFHRAAAPGLCRGCGYDLVGITSGKCPECGRAFPAADQ